MLFLEDYVEMIEHLPSELRDRFTDLREMDLSVQNRVDTLQDRQTDFFENCNKLKSAEKEEQFAEIKREYTKLIEDAGEKVQISEDCYGLVDRYLRKLDLELHKFKMELEADNRGITEILEKKSLELDLPISNSLKENRHPKKIRKSQPPISLHKFGPVTAFDRFSSETSSGQAAAAASLQLQQLFAGGPGSAIAVAASQAIAATQQLTGRRTSSLKATFEAVSSLGLHGTGFGFSKDVATPANVGYEVGPPPAKKKKSSSGSATMTTLTTPMATAAAPTISTSMSTNPGTPILDVDSLFNPDFSIEASSLSADLFGMNSTDADWNNDPSEPRYCLCNQVSYGVMVACDNHGCPYEWFHYECVGITSTPKGKWFCPTCQATATKKKGRK